jgi:hypothetical protein
VVDSSQVFLHACVLLGMIVSLGLAHLLRQFARIAEHPRDKRVYRIHLFWVVSAFLAPLHFWWWESRLSAVVAWTFNLYLFVALYALLLYLLCVFVLQDSLHDDADYRDYYHSRARWFFGMLAAVYAVDYVDTLLKGVQYLHGFGAEYPARNVLHIAACLVPMTTRNPRFHPMFAVLAVLYQLSWIVRQFEVIRCATHRIQRICTAKRRTSGASARGFGAIRAATGWTRYGGRGHRSSTSAWRIASGA